MKTKGITEAAMKAIIIYYTKTGHTREAAQDLALGMQENGVAAEVKSCREVGPRGLAGYDLILVGSPCHAGSTAPLLSGIARPLEKFLKSIPAGSLRGRKAAAFSVNAGYGARGTVRSLERLLRRTGAELASSPGPTVRAGAPLSLWRGPSASPRDREKLRRFGRQVTGRR